MNFRVSILPRAQQNIEETYAFIAEVQHQPLVAARWVHIRRGAKSNLTRGDL